MLNKNIVPLYFGAEKRALFGWYHPVGAEFQPNVGVVLCNPIGDDYVRAHRTIRHVAKSLAAAGFPVLRFDFHGTGDSTGTEEDPGRVNLWLNDIELAIDELRKLSGVEKFTLAGLKLGATLAMAAAHGRDDIESLILWSPYLNGKAYVRDSTRLHKMHKMLEPQSFAMDPPDRNIGGEECLGFILSDSTIADLEKIDLLTLKKLSAKRVLITGAGEEDAWLSLSTSLINMGLNVDIQTSRGCDKFLVMINHQAHVPKNVVESITEWMKTHAIKAKVVSDFPKPSDYIECKLLHEEPIFFGENRSLFGILHTTQMTQTKLPALVIINSGTIHRIGPHRLYVKIARKCAELGFSVFRIDLGGIGDSAACAGSEENLCYPPSAQKDIQAAFKVLETRLGIKHFVLIGLCSGADLAFKMGLNDGRVIGTIIMNPLTFCIHDPRLVEEAKKTRYFQESFTNKEKWARLLKGNINILQTVHALTMHIVSRLRYKIKPRPHLQCNSNNELEKANVAECLRRMTEKGVDALVIASDKDPGIHYVDVHFGEAMKALQDITGYRRVDFHGTDHTFTSSFAQGVLINAITDHISSKYLRKKAIYE